MKIKACTELNSSDAGMQQSPQNQGNTSGAVILWGTGFLTAVFNPEFFLGLCGVEQDRVYSETAWDGILNNSFCKCSVVYMLWFQHFF